eukprot:4999591-Pleurochrysis_carterae.AAC.1
MRKRGRPVRGEVLIRNAFLLAASKNSQTASCSSPRWERPRWTLQSAVLSSIVQTTIAQSASLNDGGARRPGEWRRRHPMNHARHGSHPMCHE